MIIVKIKSGLGNQMFMYAIGRRVQHDTRQELKHDLNWFDNLQKKDIPRTLGLDAFDLALPEATAEEIEKLKPNKYQVILEKVISRLYGNYHNHYFASFVRRKANYYFEGYFQSFKYFESIRELIIKDFTLKNGYSEVGKQVKLDIEDSTNSVALHVRRGDFVTVSNNYNGLCDASYYQKALELLGQKIGQVSVFVFSDDIEWAKANLHFENVLAVNFVSRPELGDAEELLLMSLCEHQIIANSTFSWWSAWLNKNDKKVVVVPRTWLIAKNIKYADFIPADWIKI